MATNGAQAVRSYLTALRNPSALRDDDRITQLRAKLEATEDPVERLQLHAEIAQAEAPDPGRLEDDFVTHAKAWASEHGISAEAFQAEGVDRKVLQRAGLIRGGRRGGGARARTTKARVSREDVAKAIRSHRKDRTFSVTDVREKSGGSAATVRSVMNELIEQGKIEEVGPDPEHSGPGRAATLYRKT